MTQVQQAQELLPFTGVRVQVTTTRSYEEVLARLRSGLGGMTVPDLVALTKGTGGEEEFVREVKQRWVGSGDFMLFAEIDHGGWIGKFGIQRKAMRWILGNPLIAITMIRHDIQAGLFLPVELYVVDEGDGAIVSYVRPSSLIVIRESSELLEAARALDEKLEALVMTATGS